MARCEQGYLCEVCGEEVEGLAESDLYLRYVLGEVDPESLHLAPERHIRCHPALAQFIVAEGFPPSEADGFFAKSSLDPDYVRTEETRVSEGYRRLLEVAGWPEETPITDYPPPGTLDRWTDNHPVDREGSRL